MAKLGGSGDTGACDVLSAVDREPDCAGCPFSERANKMLVRFGWIQAKYKIDITDFRVNRHNI